MAVWLGLNISENSTNAASNTSNVTVTLTIYYSGGSYNGNSPSGTVTIDGVAHNFTSNFNYAGVGQGNVGDSGSTTGFSWTGNIAHNSDGTKTLYCSAAFASGTGSGTVTTSSSKVLTNLSGGSSSGGGGDSGDGGSESGGNGGDSGGVSGGGGDNDGVVRFIFNVGEHTKIELYMNGVLYLTYTDDSSCVISSVEDSTIWTIKFSVVDDGYQLGDCTINGADGIKNPTVTMPVELVQITSNAVKIEINGLVYIYNEDMTSSKYQVYIGNSNGGFDRYIPYIYDGTDWKKC